jgi:uncharacterized protein YaiL (DUF2058 family)
MNLEAYTKEQLWSMLVEVVHASVLYYGRKAYVRDVLLQSNPTITPAELAQRLNMTEGEATVILYELTEENRGKDKPSRQTCS